MHYGCAVWSSGVSRTLEGALEGVAQVVVESVARRCTYSSCGRLGASVACQFAGCPKHFHLPCAAASGGFQCIKTHTLICSLHLDQVSLLGKILSLFSHLIISCPVDIPTFMFSMNVSFRCW